MVVFTCNNCGDSLQKPKVAKHYQFQCRTTENLTCVDCHKDFYGQDYVAHTKCVTESERYGGQNYVAKPGQNKGERKQQEWINVVKNVIETAENLTKEERNILNILSRHENIPRKKAKFFNFIRSVMGNRLNMPVIESVWSRMETAFKTAVESNKSESQTCNGNVKLEVKEETDDTSFADNPENSVVENQNNENISRENGHSIDNEAEVTGAVKKRKKSKKRDVPEVAGKEENDENERENEPPKKKHKKKSEEIVEDTTIVTSSQDKEEVGKFNWKATIIDTVASNEGMKLKKLRKKIANLYVNHCCDGVTFEKAASKFDKKLPKITEISITDDRVKIA